MAGDFTLRTNAKGFRREVTPPRLPTYAGACDCHMHIVGPFACYPLRETRTLLPHEALWEDYLNTSRVLGTDRMIIVQPSFFGIDNACTLDSVTRSGRNARAVVVIDPEISNGELEAMHARGARGVRLQSIVTGGLPMDALEHIAKRVAPLGWHLQLYLDASQIPPLIDRLRSLPVDVVFDHMAHISRGSDMSETGFVMLLELLAEGRAWVKLSNAVFPPSSERARRLIEANNQRVVWGSDWPHVAYSEDPPDDGALLDALGQWTDEDTRKRILVDNPDSLYFRS